jgi:integrase
MKEIRPPKGIGMTPDGRYYVRGRQGFDPERPTVTIRYFGSGPDGLEAAHAWLAGRSDRRKRSSSNRLTFSQLAAAYMEAKAGDLSASDAVNLFYKMRGVINPKIGAIQAHNLTPERLDRYRYARAKEGVKNTTIRRELEYVRAILNWAVHRKYLTANPMAGYQMPRRDGANILPMKTEHLNLMLQHAPPHLQRLLLISYYTGLRPGVSELFTLRWEHFDEQDRVLFIISAEKGGLEKREVPVDALYPWLVLWKKEDGGQGYIVHWRGRQITTSMKTAWRSCLKAAGITERIRPYSLRHKAVTDMLDAGADIKAVSELVGHKDIKTTMAIYQETSSTLKRSAIGSLGVTNIVTPQKNKAE